MSDDDTRQSPRERRHGSGLIFGVVLLTVGALLLAINLGYGVPEFFWEYWMYYPVVFITLGLLGVIAPSRHLTRSGGIWLLAIGIYCLIGTFQLFSLSWGSAWPIFLIAHGLVIIFVGRRFRKDRHDKDGHDKGLA
jgi:hypothetical protein